MCAKGSVLERKYVDISRRITTQKIQLCGVDLLYRLEFMCRLFVVVLFPRNKTYEVTVERAM